MTKLITPVFRASFVTVMKPKAYSAGQDPKYSIVIPLDKEDKFFEDLQKAVDQVCMDKWGEIPKKLAFKSLKDGDKEEEKYDWAGKTVITATNKSQPGILMKTEQGLVEPTTDEDIYSGAYFRASIRPYAYEFEKTRGVAISLDNVLKVKDGEKFTSKTSAADDFADFASEDWD